MYRISLDHAWIFALLLLVLSGAVFGADDLPEVLVVRGTLDTLGRDQVTFVADREHLASASLSGVTGEDLVAFRPEALRVQAELLREAQLAAGVRPEDVHPLVIVIDPASDWAFAQPWGTITFQRDGEPVEVTAPMLLMGEAADYALGYGRGSPDAARKGLAGTVCHELGHVIMFAALGLYEYKGSDIGPHMNGMMHAYETLSTPDFAFVEGFAEANAMFLMEDGKEPFPGHANRIDYRPTAEFVAGKLAALSPEDPGRERFEVVAGYVASLQAREGELRNRYDFLRSEYALAATLSRLRERLGRAATTALVQTMARHKTYTLAALVEAMAHDLPEWKLPLYEGLAEVTEERLVTAAQAAWIREQEAAGHSYEIDIDQDGAVPGTSARSAEHELFAFDPDPYPGFRDPLGGVRSDAVTLAAALERLVDPGFEGISGAGIR